jgi:hypothetical protein
MTGLARLTTMLLLACASPALAASSATFAPIGYSADDRYFAFEEFSIGDEGTAPFSSIHIIDLATGEEASGAPFLVDAGEDLYAFIDVRRDVAALAAEALGAIDIDTPGTLIALIGDGIEDAGTHLRFGVPGTDGPHPRPAPNARTHPTPPHRPHEERSEGAARTSVAFTLWLLVDNGWHTIYPQQAELPMFCPRDFRIYGVVQPYNGSDINGLVAIVSVYSSGFEGFDRRFLALPLRPRP